MTTLAQSIGQIVGAFLGQKRGSADGFAPTDTNNKLPNSFLSSDVVIKDGVTGRIPLSDLPLSVTTGGMVYQGEFDASTGTAPATPDTTNKGWMWRATAAGAVAGLSLDIGDYIVSNGTGWDQIDNVEVSVSGTSSEIVVSGSRAAGFVISLDPAFKNRLSDVETAIGTLASLTTAAKGNLVAAINELHAQIVNVGTAQEFSDALDTAFAASL